MHREKGGFQNIEPVNFGRFGNADSVFKARRSINEGKEALSLLFTQLFAIVDPFKAIFLRKNTTGCDDRPR